MFTDMSQWLSSVGFNSKIVSRDGNDLSSSSGKFSTASMPMTPRSECEILQACNLKNFGFSELKMATRNFRPDSVLGEGGFGSVFKGWIDEHSLSATRPGTGVVIAVKRLNQEGLQGHKEWLVCITSFLVLYSSFVDCIFLILERECYECRSELLVLIKELCLIKMFYERVIYMMSPILP